MCGSHLSMSPLTRVCGVRTRWWQTNAWERQLCVERQMAYVWEDLEDKVAAVNRAVLEEQQRLLQQDHAARDQRQAPHA